MAETRRLIAARAQRTLPTPRYMMPPTGGGKETDRERPPQLGQVTHLADPRKVSQAVYVEDEREDRNERKKHRVHRDFAILAPRLAPPNSTPENISRNVIDLVD